MNSEDQKEVIFFRSDIGLKALLFFLFSSFLFLSIIWLVLKLKVAGLLGGPLSPLDYLDIIRSQAGLDLGLSLLFFMMLVSRPGLFSSLVAALFYLVMVFYFLKLTGLYAYTYDSTPWSMIEYGSYMLDLPLAGSHISFTGYILLPLLLVIVLLSTTYADLKSKKGAAFAAKQFFCIVFLISLSIAPPLQKSLPSSIAFHPYIYSISGAFSDSSVSPKSGNIENIETARPADASLPSRKNIAIIILESFSNSTVNQEITPFLSSLKQQSIFFARAYADIPHTSKALISIHCGKTPYLSPFLYESVLGTPEKCLPQIFKGDSVFFQPVTKHFENREKLVGKIGFDEFFPLETLDPEGFQAVNYFSYEDDILLEQSRDWISRQKANQSNFLASYLTGTSHHNYDTPDNFEKKTYHENKKFNRYLNSASYTDRFVSKIFDQYRDLGVYEDTVFVILGDHGEGFVKSQALMHNNNIYESGLHIPLIIHTSDINEALIIDRLISQSSIKEILRLILETERPGLLADVIIKNLELKYQNGRISSCWYSDYCFAAHKKLNNRLYKYILDQRNHRELLYEIHSDPQERNNIASKNKEILETLRQEVNSYILANRLTYEDYFSSQQANYGKMKRQTFSPFQAVEY